MKGVYSSGGSTANLVALGAARQWALNQRGIDPAASGLRDDRLGIYSSARTHHTIQRSAGVLGIGRRNVRLVAVDDDERMDLDALRAALQTDAADGSFRRRWLPRRVLQNGDYGAAGTLRSAHPRTAGRVRLYARIPRRMR